MVAALTRKTFRNSILCVPAEIRACSFGRRRAGGFPALAGSVCLVGWLLGAALLLLGDCGAVVDGRVLFDGCTVPVPARWRQWHQALYISTANWQPSSCPKLLLASLTADPGATAARLFSLHSRDDACRPLAGAPWSSRPSLYTTRQQQGLPCTLRSLGGSTTGPPQQWAACCAQFVEQYWSAFSRARALAPAPKGRAC